MWFPFLYKCKYNLYKLWTWYKDLINISYIWNETKKERSWGKDWEWLVTETTDGFMVYFIPALPKKISSAWPMANSNKPSNWFCQSVGSDWEAVQ